MSQSNRHSHSQQGQGQRSLVALKDTRGFTLTETLATVIIVGLVTCCLATGIAVASTNFLRSMAQSESYMLFTSLEKTLDTELRYTSTIYASGTPDANGNVNVVGFESRRFKAGDASGRMKETRYLGTVDGTGGHAMNTYGQLAMVSETTGAATGAVNLFIGPGQYNYGLLAKVDQFIYNAKTHDFKLILTIGQVQGESADELVSEAFTVRALNKPTVKVDGSN